MTKPKALINERQETIFDTKMSKAVDDYLDSCRQFAAWKIKKRSSEKAVIDSMKEKGVMVLTVNDQKQIVYKHAEAKDSVVLRDYKPRRKGFSPRVRKNQKVG